MTLAISAATRATLGENHDRSRVAWVGDAALYAQVAAALAPDPIEHLDQQSAALLVCGGRIALLVVGLDTDPAGLGERFADLRAAVIRRPLPILALVPRHDTDLVAAVLDAGVADVAGLPLAAGEVRARFRNLKRRAGLAHRFRTKARAAKLNAMIDPVTHLFNRQYFTIEAARAIVTARRTATPLTLLMVDIDALKPINDRYGHAAGDRVLAGVAARLLTSLRTQDIVARIGGDEIAVAMPGVDVTTATRIARQLCQAIAEFHEGELPVTVSIGVAGVSSPVEDIAALLERADGALYAGKRAGRNRVAVADFDRFSRSMRENEAT